MAAAEQNEEVLEGWNTAVDDLFADQQERWGSTRGWTRSEWETALDEHAELTVEYAADGVEQLDDVDNVFVLPWHLAIHRAQDSYHDHGQVWNDYLRAVAGGRRRDLRQRVVR